MDELQVRTTTGGDATLKESALKEFRARVELLLPLADRDLPERVPIHEP